jgi:hypothetical protein
MPESAHITSIDALDAFRNALVLYVSKARPTVEEVSSDILRMRMWLQNDQRMLLEGLVRRRQRELEQAQQALFSKRVAVIKQENSVEQLAVQRAKRALDETEAKLRRLKNWNREFDSRVEPLVKQLEKLHSVLSVDLLKAQHSLAQKVSTLQAYADLSAGGGAAVSAPAAEGSSSTPTTTPQ